MKHKLSILFLLFILSSTFSIAQTYTGRVVDSETKEALSYATVRAYQLDSTFLKATMTDDKGAFSLSLNTDQIYIKVNFLGYKVSNISTPKQALGDILLIQKQMGPVEIEADAPLIEQKADRLVFNVENAISSKGGTAINVLKDTPGLNVEQDKLSIIGKGSVRVMINGRILRMSEKELMAYLNSIPSDDIKKIEVITTPPSKYDADGNGGLINIVLKKARKDSWSDQVRASYYQGFYPTVTLGNTFNFNKKKWTISVGANATKGHRFSQDNGTVYYPDAPWDIFVPIKEKEDNASLRINLDYDISKKTSIGTSYSLALSDGDHWDNGSTQIRDAQKSYIENLGFTDDDNNNNALNLHFIHKIDSLGKVISTDLDYFESRSSSKNRFSSQRFVTLPSNFQADNNSLTNIQNYSAKVDMVHPTKWANYSYGLKYTTTNTESEVALYNRSSGTPIFDASKSNEFTYKEDIQAAYIDANKSLGKKWKVKVGLRLENTHTEGYSKTMNKTNKNDYLKLFPTFYLSYLANKNHNFNFNYSRRFKRPNFQSLNPFRFYLNANSFVEGNPFLKPQINDNIEFTHTYRQFLVTNLFGYIAHNGYTQISKVDKVKKTIILRNENFYTMKMLGLKETFMYYLTDNWSTMLNLSGYYMSTEGTQPMPNNELLQGFGSSIYNKNTFVLNKKKTIKAEATFIYSGPSQVIIYDLDGSYQVNLGLNFSLMQSKMNLAINANDIFKTSPKEIRMNSNGINQSFINYYDSQNYRVSLSYSFGNNKIRGRNRKSSNSEIKNRSSK